MIKNLENSLNSVNFATLMKKYLLFVLVLIGLSGCKSEFEKIRTSGNAEMLHKKANEYFENKDYDRARTFYELIIPSFRGMKELEKIQFNYAYCEYYLKNYIIAAYNFKLFSTTFSNSNLSEEADFMIAYCNFRMSPGFRLDQDNTQKAIDGFEEFVTRYPESERIKECNKLIDQLRSKLEMKNYEEGILYLNVRNYQAAITSFDNLLKDYPETPNAEEVRFMILKASYEYAVNSIVEKQKLRFENVLEKYQDFVNKFPKSKNKKEAELYFKNTNKQIKNI
jgi:outer membrane protein assembly factor BamD